MLRTTYATKKSAVAAARRVLRGSTSRHFVAIRDPQQRWWWRIPQKDDPEILLILVRPKRRPV